MATSLRDLITALADDERARAGFGADPQGYLREHGWEDLDGNDLLTACRALVVELPLAGAVALHDLVDGAAPFDGDLGAIDGLSLVAGALAESSRADADVDGLDLLDPADSLDLPDHTDAVDRDPAATLDADEPADGGDGVEDPADDGWIGPAEAGAVDAGSDVPVGREPGVSLDDEPDPDLGGEPTPFHLEDAPFDPFEDRGTESGIWTPEIGDPAPDDDSTEPDGLDL